MPKQYRATLTGSILARKEKSRHFIWRNNRQSSLNHSPAASPSNQAATPEVPPLRRHLPSSSGTKPSRMPPTPSRLVTRSKVGTL